MTKYLLGILGLGWTLIPLGYLLIAMFAVIWVLGGTYALVVGVIAIPKLTEAKQTNDQLAIVRLQSEIQLLAVSPFFLVGGYALAKYLMTLI